jgi:hypothetical protein
LDGGWRAPAQPQRSFTLDDLAAIVYPEIAVIEKHHRATVLRCANLVAHRLGWERAQRPGRPLIYFSRCQLAAPPLFQERWGNSQSADRE